MSQVNQFHSEAMADLVNSVIDREHYLINAGIPEEEVHRVLVAEFSSLLNVSNEWSNTDTLPKLPTMTLKIPDTGYPPEPFPLKAKEYGGPYDNDGIDHHNPDPQNYEPGYAGGRDVWNLEQYKTNSPSNRVDQSAYLTDPMGNALASGMNHQTPTIGVEPYLTDSSIPPWRRDDVEQSQMTELEVTKDASGKFVKKGTTKLDLMTDISLPQYLERSRRDYLHDEEMPHMVVDLPEEPEMPHMTVEEEVEPIWAKYHFGDPHAKDDVCNKFHMKVFDLNDKVHRPVPPSEGLGYTTTHPNCKCWWQIIAKPSITTTATKPQVKQFTKIKQYITRKANSHDLHSVKPDGSLSNRTRGSNPLREAIEQIRENFTWLSDKYIDSIKNVGAPGQFYLINASQEAITDHRTEGEPYKRWLSPDELHGMARTAIGKKMDINHKPENETIAQVLDSEFNKDSKQIQMVVNEQDPEVNQAIRDGVISAVSINGGSPRQESIQCTDECFVVPEGVVLGELDGIALTWVVTDPNGMMFRGQWIPPATPGVKTTAIQPL